MPGIFVGGNEVLQNAKVLPKHCKVMHVVAIFFLGNSHAVRIEMFRTAEMTALSFSSL